MRIFDRQDFLRVNRARARIKVLVDKIGIDAFRTLVDEELEGDWVDERDFSLEEIFYDIDEQASLPGRAARGYSSANGDRRGFERFVRSNVAFQRQAGFSTVEVKVERGDLTVEQLRGLADIMRRYCGGFARTTVHQNLVLRWVRDESVYEVWRALRRARARRLRRRRGHRRGELPRHGFVQARHHEFDGAQPGGLGAPRAMEIDDPLTRRMHVKMSGCPNGCSQHHIADIGFYGASIKVGERTIPPTSRTSAAPTRAARSSTASGSRPACPPSASPRRSTGGYASTNPIAWKARPFTDSSSGWERASSRRA